MTVSGFRSDALRHSGIYVDRWSVNNGSSWPFDLHNEGTVELSGIFIITPGEIDVNQTENGYYNLRLRLRDFCCRPLRDVNLYVS